MAVAIQGYQRKSREPQEREESAIDLLLKGLSVANQVTGIYSNVQQAQAYKQKTGESEAASKSAAEAETRGRAGKMTEPELQKTLESQKFVEIRQKEGEELPPSVLRRTVIGPQGEERPILLRQVKPMEMEATQAAQQKKTEEAAKERQLKFDLETLRKESKVEAAAARNAGKSAAKRDLAGNARFKSLPPEDQKTITDLATRRGSLEYVEAGINANIESWDDPAMTDKERVQQGRQMIKLLNSLEGQDAVGVEEAKRLSGKLEMAYGNFTNDNPTQFGRDLEGFRQDIGNTLKTVMARRNALNNSIDKYYGRQPAQGGLRTPQQAPAPAQRRPFPSDSRSDQPGVPVQRIKVKNAGELPDL